MPGIIHFLTAEVTLLPPQKSIVARVGMAMDGNMHPTFPWHPHPGVLEAQMQ